MGIIKKGNEHMLHLYGGRENVDKEKFIYEHVAGETYVLVPNQYTLVAEEQALKYMKSSCLYDVEILSMNRLGLRILEEQGLEGVSMLSQTGRFMLLTRIVNDHKEDLEFFRRSAGKVTFTKMLSDFVSEFKQQNCSVDELLAMVDSDETDTVLRDKLHELEGILKAYEQSLKGRYTDGEDYIAMYVDAIRNSKLIRGKTIWVYGYDSITPKFKSAVLELAAHAKEVNLILNRSDYDLDRSMERMLREDASARGIAIDVRDIGEEYRISGSRTIEIIEENLFADDRQADASSTDTAGKDLKIVECANQYYEAESAAAYVRTLLRDNGYKMKDITIICSDQQVLQPVVQRVFAEYGLDVFIDAKRSITDTAPVCFIAALLNLMKYRCNTDLIITLLKTGISGFDRDEIEKLEIYARKYRIVGTMWLRPFKYGLEEYGEEPWGQLEALRALIAGKIEALEKVVAESRNAEAFALNFRDYLEEEWNYSEASEQFADRQAEQGLLEDAIKTASSVEEAFKVLDQLVEIMGSDETDISELAEIYEAGLASVQVGIIPPSMDGILMGTMIRTRPRPAKAVLVLGANEGMLPMQPAPEGLFSVDEKSFFKERNFALGALDDIKMAEENVAVYRMLSKPSEKLYISYSMTDTEGSNLSPSTIIDELKELFPALEVDKDIVSNGLSKDLVSYRYEAARHLINHLKDSKAPDKLDSLSCALLEWFEKNEPDTIERLLTVAKDSNKVDELGKGLSRELFANRYGKYVFSASALENYTECPFRYFVDRGLKPYEDRSFTSDARSIGDVYHECLMEVGRKLAPGGNVRADITDVSLDAIDKMVSEELDKIASNYRDGLFVQEGVENYRLSRIKEICAAAARAMAKQLAAGTVTTAKFEESFGQGCEFSPVELEVNGEKIYVEGKIDRADILVGGKARIIDYKTGRDKLDTYKMAQGYKMQLMIYLMSVTSGEYEPAGMFYFNISQNQESANSISTSKFDAISARDAEDDFKLKGAYLDEEGNLDLMPEDALWHGKKDLISRDEFDYLEQEVRTRISEAGDRIVNGDIRISPLKTDKLVCGYCRYRAICKYDSSYEGNRSRELKSKPRKKEETAKQ